VREERNAYIILVEKSEGWRPLGIPRRIWLIGIRIDLRELSWEDVDYIHLAQYRHRWKALVNTVMNLWVP
jgi:hypothetical protein